MIRRTLCFVVTLIVILSQLVTVAEADFDRNFYSTNDILFYDPRCDTSTATGEIISLNGRDNITKILTFLMAPAQGLTLAQASGVIGNLMAESGQTIDPSIIQGGGHADKNYVPVDGVGFGIAQWTFSGRQVPLENYMRPYGDITSLDGQVGFMWSELTGTHADALRELKQTTTPLDAAVAFHKYYEGSADSAAQVASGRGGNAEKVYNTFVDEPALAGSTGTPATDNQADPNATNPNAAATTGSQSCITTADGQGLIKTVQGYAWPEYKGNTIIATDAYKSAVQAALGQGRYVGGISYPGIDCGGFVTTLMIDSGFDKTYNHSGLISQGAGYTNIQEAWLQQNWKKISDDDATDRQPGDVAISDSHTYVFVGPDAFANHKPIASASLDERAPMQGNESVAGGGFRWYRKPASAPSTSSDLAKTAGGGGGSW